MRLNWFNNPARSFTNPIINQVKNFWKRIFYTKAVIYHCFCGWVEINWSKFNIFIWLVFFNVTFSAIWYLKPFASFKRSLNKSLILDLLASNCVIESFFLNYFNFVTHCISSKHTICFYHVQFFIKKEFRKHINAF